MGEGLGGQFFASKRAGTNSISCKMGNMGYCRSKKDGEEVVQGLLKLSNRHE